MRTSRKTRQTSAMEYFRKYLGAPQEGGQPTGAETVERLVDRVQSSTLLDDRRDAVRALKAMSKKFRLEVGTQGMDILTKTLETDRGDAEITGYALDALCNILSNEPLDDDEEEMQENVPDDLGNQFTEIFIKKTDNVPALLSLLEEYDFHIRWPTVRLLTILLTNKGKDLQEIILVSPMGVSKLMDLLSDSREIIRNDALLLLIQLTKNNANLQKIVAFENAFERLFDVIAEEGDSDGGIVVEDCLILLLNLLKNNASNQNFFRESSFIQRLSPFFNLKSDQQASQPGWSAQKVTNIHKMLQLVRTLVSPNSPQQQMSACQRSMFQCGLVQQLCTILMASGVPADVLTETINTVAEVIRGNPQNQEYFASVMAPSNPPRPAIVVLLMSMVNEKQPFTLRCAVLYCFQSFLYRNEIGQSQIVQTLLPTSSDANTISAGQLLCGGLFSADCLSNWFAAVALLHAIMENPTQKEQLLRVQLATSLGSPPVSLLQQCCNILSQGGKIQTRVGLLMLMCGWMSSCPIVVAHFLTNTANIPFLITQVSASESDENETLVQGLCSFLLGICVLDNDDQNETFNRASLRQIIEKRIGLESFSDKLTQIPKNESYTKAAKKPNFTYKHPSEVVFDFEFTRIFKSLEVDILNTVSPNANAAEQKQKIANLQEHEKVVNQYKELIQEQDTQLKSVTLELEQMRYQNTTSTGQLSEIREQVQQLKDQNALLKAQKGSQGAMLDTKKDDDLKNLQEELERLKLNVTEKETAIEKLKGDLTVSDAKVLAYQTAGEEDKENNPSEVAVLQATVNRIKCDLQEAQHMVTERDAEVSRLTTLHSEAQKQIECLNQTKNETSSQVTGGGDTVLLKEEVQKLSNEKSALQERLTKANEESLNLIDKANKAHEETKKVAKEKSEVEEELDNLKKEQEDLLVLLADQDTKIDAYKTRLKELGEQVEEDDDDDDLGDEDLDEDDD
ncbi:general vesicular transport factor p115-like isoform X2 [Pecten maximus]|uniref:general vesicular transport factor p115-like isoform X2 n=1 Tax=Pecten maximus TaxID=6579 RepID=UPI001458EC4C|nr:general vesicular transport factor p115-like isoform X2 [Pecten maximus]